MREGLPGWSLSKPGRWLHCLALWWLELPVGKSSFCCFSRDVLIAIFPSCSTAGDLKASLKKLLMWLLNYLANPLGLLYVLLRNFSLGPLACCFTLPSLIKRKVTVKVSVRWESVLTLSLPVRKPRRGFWDLCLISIWFCSFGCWLGLYGTLSSRDICSADSHYKQASAFVGQRILWPSLQVSLGVAFHESAFSSALALQTG